MRGSFTTPDRSDSRIRRRAVALVMALAGACTRTPEPAAAPSEAQPAAPASDARVNEAPPPAPAQRPVEAKSEPAAPRACEAGERLDTGCECRSGGACFDTCCGADAGCAHPAQPGGKSACVLATPPPKQQRACKDGEALADGCRCDDTTCMDICCVGSACSHHASPDGGWAKCMNIRR